MKKIAISTVTPVYAGREYILELVSKIEGIRNQWDESGAPLMLTEAIFVNDASQDGSLELLYGIGKDKPWIKIINLSRNFGQHQATAAGVLHSSGDWIVTLDEDLQHDPQFIETLLKKAVTSSLDVVYANPEQSVHESAVRDWSSKAFKAAVSFSTGNKYVRDFNSFRLIRGAIARAAASVCSHGTYFDIALCWFSKSISSILLPLKDLRYVESGSSGYTIRKLFSHARRMIVSSDVKVVRLGATIGFFAMSFSFLVALVVLIGKLVNPSFFPVQGWASLFLGVLFFNGLLAILIGIVLEYLSVILLHIQGKPTFFTVDRLSDDILLKYFSEGDGNVDSP
jgi:polyisoprenyl-phosphate glycosyltransferase